MWFYFQENPCHHPIVILKDVLYADLVAILNFMYHGEVLILKDQLPSFLQTAKVLQVSGLAGCDNFHIKNVTQKCKSQKNTQAKDNTEPMPKRTKIVKKPKSVISSPTHGMELSNSYKNTSEKPKEAQLEVCTDKIKIEIEDDDVDSRKLAVRTPELQPSILERSLMSLPQGKEVVQM